MTTKTDLSASPLIESRDDLLSVFQGGERPDDAKVAEFRKNWEAMLGMLKTAAEEKALAEA